MLLAGVMVFSAISINVFAVEVPKTETETTVIDEQVEKENPEIDVEVEEDDLIAFSGNYEEAYKEEIGLIDRENPESIELETGEKVALLITFENQDEALENVKKTIPNYLEHLQNTYHLDEISENNYQEYWGPALTEMGLNDANGILLGFLDIYENADNNQEIKDFIEDNENLPLTRNSRSSTANNFMSQLASKLPDVEDNEEFIQANPNKEIPSKTRATFNVNSAKSYASKYATNKAGTAAFNYKDRGSNANCTNFASQILWAGGYRKAEWWYPLQHAVYGWSEEWHTADDFAKNVVKKVNTTKGIAQFSKDAKAGYFGAIDFSSDGSWDHIGFIYDKKTTMNNRGFYDFQIAQHSRDYFGWASSTADGWVYSVATGASGTLGVFRANV